MDDVKLQELRRQRLNSASAKRKEKRKKLIHRAYLLFCANIKNMRDAIAAYTLRSDLKLWLPEFLIRKFRLWQQIRQIVSASAPTYFHVAIRITGGVGDLVVITRWLKQFIERFGQVLTIDVYFNSPKIAQSILSAIEVRAIYPDWKFYKLNACYDCSFDVSQFISFHWARFDSERIARICPDFIGFAANIEIAQQPFQEFIEKHPYLDGAFADVVASNGQSRQNFLSQISGFEDAPLKLNIASEPIDSVPEMQTSSDYLTIHDGWDSNFVISSARPTKAYPIRSFAEAVRIVKSRHPDLKIVQLGTLNGTKIPGIDIDLRERTSMGQAAAIIRGAKAHIDTEGGLVHLAASLGIRSVVIFGPTNLEYYGYGQNKNLAPEACGNCMWVTDSWMSVCPLEFPEPICMLSVTPERVANAVDGLLARKNTSAGLSPN